MTAGTVSVASPRSVALRALAGVEARRYARHPLFLVGVALLVGTAAFSSGQLKSPGDTPTQPAFFLGLLGVLVGFQLTRSMARSTDAVDASPTDQVTRSAALCLACLVPGAVALAWFAWASIVMAISPIPDTAAISSSGRVLMLAASIAYAVGGPLFGVMVGRWTTFPGAGVVAVVVLFLWTLVGTFGLRMPASRLSTLVHLNAPFTSWVSSDGPAPAPLWVAGGSPGWYLLYITLLCGLAATAAVLHGAWGTRRSWLIRASVLLGMLAIASLALAVSADPTRIPL
jgi:xanthosine utilization system XapX-like protein